MSLCPHQSLLKELNSYKWKPGRLIKCDNQKSINEKFIDYIMSENPTKGIEEEIWNELFKNSYRQELPKVSPHWPGVGKYIGTVDDEKPVLFLHEGFNSYDYWDKQPWQKNRVYNDEIPFRKMVYHSNRVRKGKSVPEIMYNFSRDLDQKLTVFYNGEKI